jgi:hypothetical protein
MDMALNSSDGRGELEPVLLRFEYVDDESETSPDECFSSLLFDVMMSMTVVVRGLDVGSHETSREIYT